MVSSTASAGAHPRRRGGPAPGCSRGPWPRCAPRAARPRPARATSSSSPASHIRCTRTRDPLVQLGAGHGEADHHGGHEVLAGGQGRRERPPGQLDHLERAHDRDGRCSPGWRSRPRGPARSAASRSTVDAELARARPPARPGPRGRWAGSPAGPARRARRGPSRRRAAARARGPGSRRGPRAASRWYAATLASCRTSEDVELVVGDAAALGHRELGRADVHPR